MEISSVTHGTKISVTHGTNIKWPNFAFFINVLHYFGIGHGDME